jgi:hypothetical protein
MRWELTLRIGMSPWHHVTLNHSPYCTSKFVMPTHKSQMVKTIDDSVYLYSLF